MCVYTYVYVDQYSTYMYRYLFCLGPRPGLREILPGRGEDVQEPRSVVALCDCSSFRAVRTGASILDSQWTHTQRAQYGLVKEYTLNSLIKPYWAPWYCVVPAPACIDGSKRVAGVQAVGMHWAPMIPKALFSGICMKM